MFRFPKSRQLKFRNICKIKQQLILLHSSAKRFLWKVAKQECTRRRQKIPKRLNTRNIYFKFKHIIHFVICCEIFSLYQYLNYFNIAKMIENACDITIHFKIWKLFFFSTEIGKIAKKQSCKNTKRGRCKLIFFIRNRTFTIAFKTT